MMRDAGARFKYTALGSGGDSHPTDDPEPADDAGEQRQPPPELAADACPSRELILQRLRSYHRDVASGAATWRAVSARMQRDLAPYAALKLGGFSLGDVAPKLLGHVLAASDSRLRTLDLGFNRIGDRGAALLARALETNGALERLYLSGNDIGPAGAQALARALTTNATLRSLHLSGNNVGEAGAAHLADGLRANRGLRALYVGTNGIGSGGMAALADALTVNRSLRELTLGQNRIGSDGLRHMAAALASGRTLLTTLEVGKNGIDHHGALALARALCASGAQHALENLYLDNNPLGDAGASAFGALLAKAPAAGGLRVLDLSYSHMSLLGLRDLSMGLAHSASLLCLLLDGHDWASTQYMGKASGALAGAALSAKAANSYAASCIAGAVSSNPRSALLKLTGVDLSLVVAAPPLARSDAFDSAPAAEEGVGSNSSSNSNSNSSSTVSPGATRRYSDALTRNERVLRFLHESRRPAASNKRKLGVDDADDVDGQRSAAAAHSDNTEQEATHPKYQRLDARGPVRSSSSSGSISSSSSDSNQTAPAPESSPETAGVAAGTGGTAVGPQPLQPSPTYASRRPPRVGMSSRGSLAQLPSPAAGSRLALKSPRYESTMAAQARQVIAEIAALPFDADEYANLQVYYLGRCHGAKDPAAQARSSTCSADTTAPERNLCPACQTSRLAKFRRVMALKTRLEARQEASDAKLLVLLRQLHYLIGVFQHVEDAERRIDEILAAAHDPAPPRHPHPPSSSSPASSAQLMN